MRALVVAVLTAGGIVIGQWWSPVYAGAVGICVLSFLAVLRASLRAPRVASLRHAAIGSGAAALVAVIVGVLLAIGTDLPYDVRVALRIVILAATTAPALYWLLLLVTDGFARDEAADPTIYGGDTPYPGEGDH